jgi:hypothetical protein
MKPLRRCDTCANASNEAEQGLMCLAHAPQVTIVALPARTSLGQTTIAPQAMAAWPPVRPDQWCMEWQPEFQLTS